MALLLSVALSSAVTGCGRTGLVPGVDFDEADNRSGSGATDGGSSYGGASALGGGAFGGSSLGAAPNLGGSGGIGLGGATFGGSAVGGTASGGSSFGGTPIGGTASGGAAAGGTASGGANMGGVGGGAAGGPIGGAPGCNTQMGEVQGADGCEVIVAPRLIGPLATATVTHDRPTLIWEYGVEIDSVHVELCADRACKTLLQSFDSFAMRATPPQALPPGIVFWRAFGRKKGVVGILPSKTWQFTVRHQSAVRDSSWGTTLDVNGDGFADAIVGSPAYGTGGPPRADPGVGHAYLLEGSAQGLQPKPATKLTSPAGVNGQFGAVVASASDVNGDGFADVIVGAPGAEALRAGRAYVYLGSESGLSTVPSTVLSGPTDQNANFGAAVASVGDVNNDGYADVVVGAPGAGDGPAFQQYRGRVYVFLGGAGGISSTPSQVLKSPDPLGTNFGWVIENAGDLNDDGRSDFVVAGKPYVFVGPSAYTTTGAFYIYLGSSSVNGGVLNATLGDQNWAFAAAAGGLDLNQDGFADLGIGTAGNVNSAVFYFASASGIAQMPDYDVAPQSGSGSYNYRLCRGGDFNGDGYDDFLASYDQVFAYAGRAGGLVDNPSIITPATKMPPGPYAFLINQVGDFNRDGYDDVVVGARFENNFAGAVFVYMGSAAGLAKDPAVVIQGFDGPGTQFG